MSQDRFQRMMTLTDAVHSRLVTTESAPLAYATDPALHADVQAVFDAQGLTVPPEVIQAAAADLDDAHHRLLTAPIVPLPVVAQPLKSSWWHRRNHAQTKAANLRQEWATAFNQVRKERQAEHAGEGPNRMPLTVPHQALLQGVIQRGALPSMAVPYQLSAGDYAQKECKDYLNGIDPLMACIRIAVSWYSVDRVQQFADVGLAKALLGWAPGRIHHRFSNGEWNYNRESMAGAKGGLSVANMLARELRVSLLEGIGVRWATPTRWDHSALWFVLVLPMKNPSWDQIQKKQWSMAWSMEKWETKVEAAVRYVLVHEADSAEHHARVIREAIAMGHQHANWLKQWLPEHAQGVAKVSLA